MSAPHRWLVLPVLVALAIAGACSAPRPAQVSVAAVATSHVPPELLLGATPAPTATARTFAPAPTATPGGAPAAPTPSVVPSPTR